jgi:hypothetical protein
MNDVASLDANQSVNNDADFADIFNDVDDDDEEDEDDIEQPVK